ncbi:MAG: DUF2975 domain-containing protein [Oscillospiraceae bacterium]|nr:DUF2975 domain-containing protein [Oscillospiraceae bacterium]
MWNKDRSLLLSLGLVRALLIIIPVLCLCSPWMVRWYDLTDLDGIGLLDGSVFVPLMLCLNTAGVCAMVCLVYLYRLLANIRKSEVFVHQNCKCLRIISWCCLLASVPFAVFGLWRFLSFVMAFTALFFGIILRVVKNVIEQAVALREENDYTI